ncbi:MAG: divergent polysaccharide deacetylase family protein [Oceanospirillaceae bacterium]
MAIISTLIIAAPIVSGNELGLSLTEQVDEPVKKPAQLILLIDDMGNSQASNQAALDLPGAVSFAFLPYAHFSKRFAIQAKKRNKDVLLHAPMQSINNNPLGVGGLTADMSETDFKQTLNKSIDALPNLIGVNNHMGSRLTALNLPMQWTMEVVKQRGLFFVDSKTTGKSVAWKQAQKAGLNSLKRDVFLDHELSLPAIQKQFSKAKTIAKRYGTVLVIAHPHAITLKFLKQQLPLLENQQIELVSLSTVIAQSSSGKQLVKEIVSKTEQQPVLPISIKSVIN